MDRPGGWPRGRLLLAWLLLIGGAVFLGSFLAALFLGLLLDFRFGLRTGGLVSPPGRAKLIVDLDDPERAVIYAYT